MSTNAPVYLAISQVVSGAPASIATINTPLTQITSNIQTIINYLTNDGAGSGINSDLLDGQHGVFYQNASNLTAGTLPASTFSDTSHGNRSGGTLHAAVTESVNGFMAATDKAKLDGIASGANNYSLPIATTSVLGGVKQGTLITIAADGTISANNQSYSLPIATATVLGGVMQGTLVSINASGVLSANVQSDNNFTSTLLSKLNGIANNANAYVLPAATTSALGGVIVAGSFLAVDGSGNLSVVTTNLPLLNASSNTFTGNQYAPDFISQSNSDRVLKDHLREIKAMDYDFSSLRLYDWDWNAKATLKGHAVGTVADELAKIVPHDDVVVYSEDGRATGVNYGKAAFLLAMWLKEKLGV